MGDGEHGLNLGVDCPRKITRDVGSEACINLQPWPQ